MGDDSAKLRIGTVCYPLIGGSGILATELGHALAARGHAVHFLSYAKPVRLHAEAPGIHFHEVKVGEYSLFKYPDYTLPLAVRMAEVAEREALDLWHVHYAVPHATAAFLAGQLMGERRPKVVTTLHGTDTTLFGEDPNYRAVIEHALRQSDRLTTVSDSLRGQTRAAFSLGGRIDVIHNFYEPEPAKRSRAAVRADLGLREDEHLLLHMSNLRPVKRVDLLLRSVAAMSERSRVRLLILAGGSFAPYEGLVRELGLEETVLVRVNVGEVEDYLQAADGAVYTSEKESFGLSILESMYFGLPVVAFGVGGVPEVVEDGRTGSLCAFGEVDGVASALDRLVRDPALAREMGAAGRARAQALFSEDAIVPQYEALYHEVLAGASRQA
ncbi:MAG: N-acetyl-alpha-D-glucosaminyl L-malate synthase BshA [Opitutales bacterium]